MTFNIGEVPKDVADCVRAIGPVEWGCTYTQDDEAHIKEFADTLRLTREFSGIEGDTKVSGVYLDGTHVVLAHTGTSPNSPQHARILTSLWNWFHGIVTSPLAANDNIMAAARAAQINDLVSYFHTKSSEAGWWDENGRSLRDDKYVHATKLMLVVTELAEAMEGLRKGLQDDKLSHRKMAEVELADALIRIFDLAGVLGYDLGGAVVEKDAFNSIRPDHKIENRVAAGGKAY